MSAHRISLDGPWQFQIDPANGWDVAAVRAWRTAQVPMPWQAQFDDLRLASGTAWYRRTVAVDPAALDALPERAAILHFGAVDYHATVWLNGACVGDHEGGYLPFEFDVAAHLRPGDNDLVVRVEDAGDDRATYPDRPFSEVPHGKQSWYGPIGGLWQSVWLELRPRLHIADLQLAPDPADGAVRVEVRLSEALPDGAEIHLSLLAPDGSPLVSETLPSETTGTLRLDRPPALWSPETPALYTVAATLDAPGAPAHSIRKSCGFRTVESRDGRIYLNGEPIYLRGVLDQGYYPETIYTPPSVAYLEQQARAFKELGFNCLRIHIKPEDPAYYDVADRLGLFVWTEIPNWALLTDASSARGKSTFRQMVARDGHHPSIIAWTLINENWGTDLTRNAEHRRWLANFCAEAKALDPTRIVVDNSACVGNAHVAGDLEDFHWYKVLPDHAPGWDEWVADFARRADWVWYEDYARNRRPDLPLVASEFGNWGLPDPAAIQEQGGEPWWFETGHDWGEGIVYPHGVEHRFHACGLGALYPAYADFARDSQAHMARSLHYAISTMRLHDPIAGYIVTEATDVHWECNGMLTMQRAPKHLLDPVLKEINQDNVVVLRPQAWSGRPGDTLQVDVQTKGVDGPGTRGRVLWEAGDAHGEVAPPGGAIPVPLDAPGIVTLSARWQAADGSLLAANRVELACVAPPVPSNPVHIADDAGLAAVLANLGYAVTSGEPLPDPATGVTVVARIYTRALEAYVQQGGRFVLLADTGAIAPAVLSAGAISTAAPALEAVRLPVGQIVPRAHTVWEGDWANSFAWLRKQGPFASLPGGPLLEMEWEPLMPESVLTGLPPWILHAHSWAGLAVGWIHRPVSLLTVIPWGSGRIAMTTFRLDDGTLGANAIAQTLFAGLIGLLGDEPQ
jgi:hypothetical protein